MARHEYRIKSNKNESTWDLSHWVEDELVGQVELDTAEVVLRVLEGRLPETEATDDALEDYLLREQSANEMYPEDEREQASKEFHSLAGWERSLLYDDLHG